MCLSIEKMLCILRRKHCLDISFHISQVGHCICSYLRCNMSLSGILVMKFIKYFSSLFGIIAVICLLCVILVPLQGFGTMVGLPPDLHPENVAQWDSYRPFFLGGFALALTACIVLEVSYRKTKRRIDELEIELYKQRHPG